MLTQTVKRIKIMVCSRDHHCCQFVGWLSGDVCSFSASSLLLPLSVSSVSVSVCLFLPFSPSLSDSPSLSLPLSVCLSVCLFLPLLCPCLPDWKTVSASLCVFLYLSLSLCVYAYTYIHLHPRAESHFKNLSTVSLLAVSMAHPYISGGNPIVVISNWWTTIIWLVEWIYFSLWLIRVNRRHTIPQVWRAKSLD